MFQAAFIMESSSIPEYSHPRGSEWGQTGIVKGNIMLYFHIMLGARGLLLIKNIYLMILSYLLFSHLLQQTGRQIPFILPIHGHNQHATRSLYSIGMHNMYFICMHHHFAGKYNYFREIFSFRTILTSSFRLGITFSWNQPNSINA